MEKGDTSQSSTLAKAPFAVALIAAVVGMVLSVQLIQVHNQVSDPTGPRPTCDINAQFSCSPVAEDTCAAFLGVPTAAWGLLAYAWFAALALAGVLRRPFPRGPGGIFVVAATGAFVFGLYLFYRMHFIIGAYCTKCLGLDVVNLVLFIAAIVSLRGRGLVGSIKGDLELMGTHQPVGFGVFGGPILAGLIVFAAYPRSNAEGPGGGGDDADFVMPEAAPTGGDVSTEGVPCIGPADAPLQIFEFSDYQCPHCQRAHTDVRTVVDRLDDDDVRFCHFHHPLDMACNPALERPMHEWACFAAAAAVCAQHQDKFWVLNDLLFENGRRLNEELVFSLASQARLDIDRFRTCVRSDSSTDRIRHELTESRQVPVNGTPTFVINGRVIPGALRARDFESLFRLLVEHDGSWEAAAAAVEARGERDGG